MYACYLYGAVSKRRALIQCAGLFLYILFFALPHSYAGQTIGPSEQRMAEEFLALRQIKGHFQGGEWNDAVDKWQGDKHRLLQQALAVILQGDYGSQQLRALLGEPDRVWSKAAPGYAQILEQTEWQGAPSGELWAYYWRGEHDQLIIAVEQDRAGAGGWLLAWE